MTREASNPDEHVAAAIGRVMAFWGFRRNLGRIWSLLFLSPAPLTAAELCDRLQLSAGSVSMALKELQRWGAVHKRHVAGERREHYEAEPDIWRTVARVMEQREAREVDQVLSALKQADVTVEAEIAAATEGGDDEALQAALFRAERIDELRALARAGQDLLSLVLGQESVDQLVRTPEDFEGAERRPMLPRIPRAPRDEG